MAPRSTRLFWWLGGVGSLLWLPIMSCVWLLQGNVAGAALGAAIAAIGVGYLIFFAPWRFPRTPMRWLVLGFVAILLAGAAAAVWQVRTTLKAGGPVPLVVLWTLFVPFFPLGRKSWSDLHAQGE